MLNRDNSHVKSEASSSTSGQGPYTDPAYLDQLFREDYSKYVDNLPQEDLEQQVVASQLPELQPFQRLARSLNGRIRDNYAQIVYKVGRNIFPLIVAIENEQDNTGIGGTYVLFTADGKAEYIRPVEVTYEYYKTVSHMPLGIFSIISPYFNQSNEKQSWKEPLNGLLLDISNILTNLSSSELDVASMERIKQMLEITISYINDCLTTGISQEKFQSYSQQVMGAIEVNVKAAASMQVVAVKTALQVVKEKLGEAWPELFVVVPTIWPVSQNSPREQIFRSIMDPKTVNTHLIVAEGVRSIEEARTLIGRIVYDRYAARSIFGIKTEKRRQFAAALSTPVDLMGQDAKDKLRSLDPAATSSEKRSCVSGNGMFATGSSQYGGECPFRHPPRNGSGGASP
ncbi:MAG: hypothetical protein A3E84_01405 [Gammaproteobacteria bacterium RIFCSPHIGHO2_12_FULL_42_13]|nr:MAG: hypothetical protein A3E84_01405 [Gammaproteobacteria bacterium RIFCSPHIGHO2_12_FULL_42_13]